MGPAAVVSQALGGSIGGAGAKEVRRVSGVGKNADRAGTGMESAGPEAVSVATGQWL
ncbi:hypothetical protein Sphch_3378 [Sphingobium chlorophenolicum L-1]|uniref:Uncharacterized protein n=2 Tax=Sphingobium chlorophenolicum TaxID=46429 RepID=F6F3G2_SPHCR|nr:hypothetical protein Sphch_3378 [Sphingobium chlorophenolicum L-1]KEQ51596.1 hypothetical protein BV95_04155 [Sphingobium chlorophenolicum]